MVIKLFIGEEMLNSSDSSELSTSSWMFTICSFTGGVFLLNPIFYNKDILIYLLIFMILQVLFIIGRAYFKSCEILTIKYLLWQVLISTSALAFTMSVALYCWFSSKGGILGGVIMIGIFLFTSLIGFLVRALDPQSNYQSGINKGRFTLSTFNFNSSVWQKEISNDNPVLVFLGLEKRNKGSSLKSTIRKGAFGAAIISSLGIIIKSSGGSGFFEALLLTIGASTFGYIFTSCCIADLLFCLKAGYSKNKK